MQVIAKTWKKSCSADAVSKLDSPLACRSFLGGDAALKAMNCDAMHVKSKICESFIFETLIENGAATRQLLVTV